MLPFRKPTLRKTLAAIGAALGLLLAPAIQARAPQPPENRPALWKVADADTTIYLFGTIHALPPNVSWYRGTIAEAFEGSQEVVTELGEPDLAQMQESLLARAVLPEGQTLRGLLSPEERTAYEQALASLDLSPVLFDRFEPWSPAIVLALVPLQRAGFAQETGVESQLIARAKALGRPLSGLETIDYQLGLFDSLSPEAQKHYLMEVVKAIPTVVQDIQPIIEAWKAGDADRLAQLINAEQDNPALAEALITNRNKAWADWIKARLDKPGRVFVAVGAGHLAGPGSVQDQLAAQGVTATRLQ